ncbi:alpha/beta hydrolase [Niveispirillum sp. KHB5.9]|uniref:alpha/beta hydrolase n=1 Tax=Niveispirillum sp. KHB5.9 TaxID=3400269 RepID=UPI003A872751
MALDPDARRLLDMAASMGAPPLDAMSVPEARAAVQAMTAMLQPPPVAHRMRAIDLGGVPARIYRPADAENAAILPAYIHLHGGGWVLGDLDGCHSFCAEIAATAGIAVIAIDYRLAPEHPFPAGLTDSLTAVRVVVEQAASLGIAPSRLSIGGDSAGGNLAAVTCLSLRDEGGPALRAQVLLYPVTDLRMQTASYAMPDGDGLLTAGMMRWFSDLYAGDAADWRVSPLLADSNAGLPPAYVITCGFDPLRDEGRAYAAALVQAGGAVTHVPYPDQFHGFLFMGAAISAAGPAIADVAGYLRRVLCTEV